MTFVPVPVTVPFTGGVTSNKTQRIAVHIGVWSEMAGMGEFSLPEATTAWTWGG